LKGASKHAMAGTIASQHLLTIGYFADDCIKAIIDELCPITKGFIRPSI